ncbi:MAG: hypothetical protein JXB34_03755 [Bacteroidales bacterium]|nr:hypothetical protein [Bacteroidales bacterium]
MSKKAKLLSALLFLLLAPAYCQIKGFKYRVPITGVSDTWHSYTLDTEIFGKLENGLNDIRIVGFGPSDTIEAPYIINQHLRKESLNQIETQLLNLTKKGNVWYYTIKVGAGKVLNKFDLKFNRSNFDYLLTLEGSHNQQQWFEIPGKYRVISIVDGQIAYEYSSLHFSNSDFCFYRISFSSANNPLLGSISAYYVSTDTGMYLSSSYKTTSLAIDRQLRTSVYSIELPMALPVSGITVICADSFDYYRKATIECLTDSTPAPDGWIKRYSTLTSSYISSIAENTFWFAPSITKQVKLTVFNQYNHPLQIDSIKVYSNIVSLTARFTKGYRYYLYYGNRYCEYPGYDINFFRDKIPENTSFVFTGNQEKLFETGSMEQNGNKSQEIWLWLLMGAIVMLLAFFTLNMIKTKQNSETN